LSVIESASSRWNTYIVTVIICVALLIAGILLSVSIGVIDVSWKEVTRALLGKAQTKNELVISTIRVPRTLMAALVGAGLAVAGAMMQAVTRNPFASPQILGINSGAALIVVLSIVLYPSMSPTSLVLAAFAGASMGGALVFALGYTNDERAPVNLALAGIAVSMFLTAMTEGFIVLYDNQTQSILFWLAGAVHGGTWSDVYTLMPWMGIGFFISILLSRNLTILSLGDDIAKGIGLKVHRIRLFVACAVIVLAGSAVSVAGPIGFVGLIVPHIVRYIIGVDYRFVIPLSALFGAILLIYADLISRFIAFPFESPVGIVTAAIGAPFFLYLILKRRRAS